MIISLNTNALNKAIQTVQKAISSKPSTPIFSGIHLFTNNGKLELQAMDINLAISCTIDANITEPGEIIVSAKHLSELIRKLSVDTITLATNEDGKSMKITTGNSEFQLFLMNGLDEFPKFPVFDPTTTIAIDEDTMKTLIDKTKFACSTDEARPLFTGILVILEEQQITFVATNTHRLAIKSQPYEVQTPLEMIIPAKVLEEIARTLGGDVPGQINISLLNNRLMLSVDNIVMVSRLIEGRFPDYHKVIPPKFERTTKVNVKALASAVERIALFSTDNDYSIIKINVEANQMTLSSSSVEVGTGMEVIPCETFGDNLNIAFNAQYLLDILKRISGEEIVISMNSSLAPAQITSPEEADYIYIITPVRVVF